MSLTVHSSADLSISCRSVATRTPPEPSPITYTPPPAASQHTSERHHQPLYLGVTPILREIAALPIVVRTPTSSRNQPSTDEVQETPRLPSSQRTHHQDNTPAQHPTSPLSPQLQQSPINNRPTDPPPPPPSQQQQSSLNSNSSETTQQNMATVPFSELYKDIPKCTSVSEA
ncbi:inactive histone-lysine N-methyltransferase 2E-like [Phlebotomus papatasi]|uniref:inactive histone-lysine N-methyltransferase 2E-like n=1 Tax=Phlebotomus papatasi TaxID=29031 RepID=UPI00248384DD|nr:inactive histone-lysine N-methyltransferase 2E-like [Phlebotomus papatasi]